MLWPGQGDDQDGERGPHVAEDHPVALVEAISQRPKHAGETHRRQQAEYEIQRSVARLPISVNDRQASYEAEPIPGVVYAISDEENSILGALSEHAEVVFPRQEILALGGLIRHNVSYGKGVAQ